MNKSTRWKLAASVLVIGLAIPAIAGARIFMSVPGAPGEVRETGFTNQIEATSISFGYSSPVDSATGKQPNLFVAPVTITKELDSSGPKLMDIGGQGLLVSTVTIKNRLEGVTNTPVFMTVTLKNVSITDYQMVVSEDRGPLEQITFQPRTVSVEYVQINAANGVAGNKFAGSFGK